VAKKITGIVCGVSWACFFGFTSSEKLLFGPNPIPGALAYIGFFAGIISGITLIAMALIDYARRPR
jgi:hypothetical protein